MKPLQGVRVLTLAVNLPGPLAAARLRDLGAAVVKVEPPGGDPLGRALPSWYRALHEGVEVFALDLKDPGGRARLDTWLAGSDLLITATRPAGLRRLGLGWDELHGRQPRLCQVAIVGYAPPQEDRPGHDLTYQAQAGLLTPPALPRTCLADLAGADRAVSAGLALLLARERGQGAQLAHVSLAEAAEAFAAPLRHGLTAPGGLLGGGSPAYNVYRALDGWVAVAALERHFAEKLETETGVAQPSQEGLQRFFLTRTAEEWQSWALARDLPLVAVGGAVMGLPGA
jgi:crotonobetainyl-CoA:carnitine CoA-transferase CaiB-like acyl-CoA transferase